MERTITPQELPSSNQPPELPNDVQVLTIQGRSFILVGTVNALLFEARLAPRLLALAPGESTPPALKAAGAVSLVSWFVVLYCGRMLPYLGAGN